MLVLAFRPLPVSYQYSYRRAARFLGANNRSRVLRFSIVQMEHRSIMRKETFTLVALCTVAFLGTANAQSSILSPLSADISLPKGEWSTSIAGRWTYRSYHNRADIIVGGNADPAVKALDPIFGQDKDGRSNAGTASSALKALNLIFGEGVITFDQPSGNNISGTLDIGNGFVLDLNGILQVSPAGDISVELVGTGRAGTPTDNWEYDYKAATTSKWANGINQIPSLVGTVIRAKPHGASPAGYVASFIAIKQ